VELVEVRRNIARGENGGTHDRSGAVITGNPIVICHHNSTDTVLMSVDEDRVLSSRVEIPSVRDWISPDNTTWQQRGAVVPFPDDSQSGGGDDRRVVRFYDPRFVFLHANCCIVTGRNNLCIGSRKRVFPVHGEMPRRGGIGVQSEEDCL